jgi:ATP-dependent helicase HrpA
VDFIIIRNEPSNRLDLLLKLRNPGNIRTFLILPMAATDLRIHEIESLLPKAMARDRAAVRQSLAKLRRAEGTPPDDRWLERIEARVAASVAARARRLQDLPPLVFPEALPITAKKDEIVAAIRQHSVTIVSGDTGSGKSTQIPKFCLAAGRGIDGLIGHTQPRRIAAQAVARRIAEEMGQAIGQAVGYKIRFQDTTPPQAYVKVMTDGILLAEAAADRMLSAYDTLIVDEAHERSLNIDFVLGYLKTLLHRRRRLRVIITSATIDTEKFSKAFDGAPVIEVSGRMYPVEVRYAPPAANADEVDSTPVEQAAAAVRRIQQEHRSGDILVFMPTEQDIREACEMIAGASPIGTQVLPLFARLSSAEQGRVFHPAAGRKIIVATNVAETSLTIPGITFVVDTGLARIPRYSPRTRTTALPVAPVSRSSADQRKGRCGRVANGVCVRLYSEEDYLGRPLYTPPEILRANLAEVILRMLALNLGDVAAFPFIDPPDSKSIADGFNLLLELGAIQEGEKGKEEVGRRKGEKGRRIELTETGRMMARVPLDPRLARMLIEAHQEGCVEEIAVIAAVLSLQDPRERPSEKTVEADRAHAVFNDRASDFLTLLAIWNRFRQTRQAGGSHSALRRFCREHFLSYRRMRDWEDIHRQIREILKEFGIRTAKKTSPSPFPLPPAAFGRLHRSILSGFLANIAQKKDKNIYRAARGREAMVFPGSGLFNQAGEWIVAAEMVETSRLFARTVATIDAGWLEAAGGRLCRSTFRDARWDAQRGEVVATEQVTLFGLVIVAARTVSYGRVRPGAATDIFIREALVAGELGKPFAFLKHNQAMATQVQTMEERVRRRDLLVSAEGMVDFYRARLAEVYDLRSLSRRIRQQGGDDFLRMTEADLMNYRPEEAELNLYPERLQAGGLTLGLSYRFEPRAEADGVTLQVPAALAAAVPPAATDWLVPGLLKEKVAVLLKGLPKALRTRLMPLKETVDAIIAEMPRGEGPLLSTLGEFLHRRFGVDVPASEWPLAALPDHLKMRVAITAPDGRELRSGRDPAILGSEEAAARIPMAVRQRWERTAITRWDFGDLPEVLSSHADDRNAWVAYPALQARADRIDLKLFGRRDQALAAHLKGVAALLALQCTREIKFLKRSLVLPEELHPAAHLLGGPRRLEDALAARVIQDLCAADVRTEKAFIDHAGACTPKMLNAGRELLYAVMPVMQAYAAAFREIEALTGPAGVVASIQGRLKEDLSHLVPPNFIVLYDGPRLAHIERYLRGLAIRARRALVDPEKDMAKAQALRKYTEQLRRMMETLNPQSSASKRRALEELVWMIEEYKVSVFAQELKTAVPMSPKRLDEKIRALERMA